MSFYTHQATVRGEIKKNNKNRTFSCNNINNKYHNYYNNDGHCSHYHCNSNNNIENNDDGINDSNDNITDSNNHDSDYKNDKGHGDNDDDFNYNDDGSSNKR